MTGQFTIKNHCSNSVTMGEFCKLSPESHIFANNFWEDSPMLLIEKLCRCFCTVLLAVIFMAFNNPVSANDIFVGKFASLPAKLLSGDGHILEIYIVPKGDKYVVTVFQKGEFKRDYLAQRCDSKKDTMMSLFARGDVYALCSGHAETFWYSQNGINESNPIIQRIMKDKNGENLSYFQAQYYLSLFAFQRVDSFKYAPNDPIKLLVHETSEFKALCKDAGVKLFEKPVAPVRSIAYDFNPKRIWGWSGAERVKVDEDGRTLEFGGFSYRNSAEASKESRFEFTERRAGDRAGRATINPSAPYYHFPTNQPYYGVDHLSADVLASLDVDKPDEYQKAPIAQGAIRYQITLTDRRSGAVLGEQVFVVDRLNHRACGVNVDKVISPSAFIFDAINR